MGTRCQKVGSGFLGVALADEAAGDLRTWEAIGTSYGVNKRWSGDHQATGGPSVSDWPHEPSLERMQAAFSAGEAT